MSYIQFKQNQTQSNFYSNSNPMIDKRLWYESQITGIFVSPKISLSKQKRFKWSSIYWPQNQQIFSNKKKRKSQVFQHAIKISKQIDQQQKNQVRMKQIKRSLSIRKTNKNANQKQIEHSLSTKKQFKLNKKNEQILMRLTSNNIKKQSLLRDRHGNRCNLFQQLNGQETDENNKKNNKFGLSTGFRTSRKIDLKLPHNYYPGPGTYDIKRYLAQLQQKSLMSTARSKIASAQ